MAALVEAARTAFLGGGAGTPSRSTYRPTCPASWRTDNASFRRWATCYPAPRSPDSSTIRVSAALDDVYVAISVADEGGGVSAERLPQLFRKFFRTEGGDDGTTVGEKAWAWQSARG